MGILRFLGAEKDTGFATFMNNINGPLNTLMIVMLAILAAAAVVFAIWVGIRLAKAEDEGKRKEAKNQLLWSIIAVVATVALAILLGTLFDPKNGLFTTTGAERNATGKNKDIISAGNEVIKAIDGAVMALLKMGSVVGIAFAVYLGVKLAIAEDEGKRKNAKQQLLWTIVAIVAAIALSMIVSGIMTVLMNSEMLK